MKLLASLLVVSVLAGCAQLQAGRTDANSDAHADAHAAPVNLVDFVIPADALGARDPKLTEILTKVGSVASKQSQSTTIVVAALPQDFAWLNQSIRRGIAPQRTNSIQLENLAVGSCQPYSIQVRPTE
ncbi:hypothetical protein [Paraburkholderia sp. BL10I2N1]|uniref:hypothetical protein n=1 Tax=Paraburkholderia sp. BL10I2N1 TaxID=1938796 RepID=UPI00105DBB89|nr:hypothetical protein [Paraburkholderia sp. BL10I2N1]TDN62674.1 hypothetical protein B0G77_6260 [Paraburkholderia sp. BL10I2N1]